MASSSRHSYSIPGASLLRPRTSSKVWVPSQYAGHDEHSYLRRAYPRRQQQQPSYGPNASSIRDRDTRQTTLSRAYSVPVAQEPSRSAPSARPPSVNGYRTQTQPQIHQSGGYAPAAHFPPGQHPATHSSYYSSSRPLHSMPQRPNPTPQASSSKARAEQSGTESRGGGVFAKMFSRVRSTSTPAQQPTPAGSGTEDNQKSSRRHKRSESAQAQPVAQLATTTTFNPPPSAPPTGRSMSEQQTKAISSRETEREERRRRKESEKERAREERQREKEERRLKERQRAESAAMEARQKAEQQAAAAVAKSTKTDRDRERLPSRRDEKQVQSRLNPVTTQSQYPTTNVAPPGNNTPPSRDSQQATAAYPLLRHPGVPIQPSNSSGQSTVSNRGYVSVTSVQGNQQLGLDTTQQTLRVPSTSAPSGADEKPRRDTERDRDREERRVRRAEREKMKEMERVAAAERERLEIERLERERRELREKERDRERSFRHRAQREKAYSLPVNSASGAMSGSDNERSNRKESRHSRSQSHTTPMAAQPYLSAMETQRNELRRDNVGNIAQQPDLNAQLRYDVVYPRSQAPQGHPPPVPQKYEQPTVQRVISDTGPSTYGHQTMTGKLPDRARLDIPGVVNPVLPPHSNGSGSGSGHTSVTVMSYPDSYSLAPPRVVSIHAAQGPPDSPMQREQKVPERSMTESAQTAPQWNGHDIDNHPRMPYDYSNIPGRAASTPSRAPSAIPVPPPTVPTYSSSSSSRYHSSSSQSQPTGTASGAQYNLHTRSDHQTLVPQAEKGLSPAGGLHPHGHGAPSPSTLPPSSSAHLIEGGYTTSVPSSVPFQTSQGSSPKGHPTSSMAQGSSPKAHTSSHVPPQAQQPTYVARATSSNSNNSPSQRISHQVPGPTQGGLFPPPGAVARTPSNTSQSAAQGYSYQQPSPPHTGQGSYSPHNPPPQATAMYPPVQNNSTNSRSSYIPSNQQQASSTQPHSYSPSYSQSQPQHSSTYPYNTSTSSLHIALPPRSDVRPSPSIQPQPNQQYPVQASSSTQNVQYSNNPSAYSHADSQAQSQGVSSSSAYYASLNSHPSSSHQSLSNLGQPYNSTTTSSTQHLQQSAALYGNNSTTSRAPDPKSQQQYLAPKSPGPPAQRTGSIPPSHADIYDNSRTPRPTDYSLNQYPSGSSSLQPTSYLSVNPQATATNLNRLPEQTSRHVSDSSVSLNRQQVPHSSDVQSATPKVNVQQIPSTQPIVQPAPVRTQQDVVTSTSTRVALPGHTYNSSSRLQEFDSPPPLTPSTSSHESHEEILMTPSSLDPSKSEQQEVSVTIQRPEKKKPSGIFGIFRSTSKPSKEPREADESRDLDSRRLSTSGPSHRPEGGNKLRSMKPPPAANQPKADNVPVKESVKLTKPSPRHHIPPPIEIPPPSALALRLVSSKSKRYRTMSAASLEALDGTANNTVVGSPTSTVRSPTPSGPMTPPIRDAVEAAHEWRNKEEMGYLKRGSHRRRRPGVTFDLTDDETPSKNNRQLRVSRIYAHREESSD